MAGEERALALLKQVLPASAVQHIGGSMYIVHVVGRSGRRYEIYGGSCRIYAGEDHVGSTCFQIAAFKDSKKELRYYPKPDRMIAEYLFIKNDEKRYLRIANVHYEHPYVDPVFPPDPPPPPLPPTTWRGFWQAVIQHWRDV